jgi:hypothetical protein
MRHFIKLSATDRDPAEYVDLDSVNRISMTEDSLVLLFDNKCFRPISDKKEIETIQFYIIENKYSRPF